MAEPSCGGRVAVTTAAEPTEELRSAVWMGGRPSRSCSGGARRLAGEGGDCVSEKVGEVAVHHGGWSQKVLFRSHHRGRIEASHA